ncbi:hypothetical protein [Rhizobium redzepovicii]|uniref:hypothetical protein n=1 Tax=Rhizobium redzepovicii TaxID=2867518 RepID=UPI002870F877|nr:hypothetical protein [Rhizobium redzepovicii]MDR9783009.1 hypothetical protein [Rhizobium redzepovicii]
MLNVYPIAATAENWVHDAVYAKVKSALEALNGGFAAPDWAADMHKDLADREALKTRYDAFRTAAEALSVKQRIKVLRVLKDQNNIPAVFDGVADCPRIAATPVRIRKPTAALFTAAFDALKTLKVRDRQYQTIFGDLPGKCCPFCGIEPFEAPGLAREDMDHYLPRSLYPFAGANLRNLAPMGGKCNRAYKQALDIICDDAGQRRRCFDPYGENRATVSLMESRPFEGGGAGPFPLTVWQVDLLGDADSVATWDQVFQIRRRYQGKVESHFREWMEHFAVWCEGQVGLITTHEEVIAALERYLTFVLQRTHDDGAHLKRAVFEMLRQQCAQSDMADRLTSWLSALVKGQRQLVA